MRIRKGEIQGTFNFSVNCNIKKFIDEALEAKLPDIKDDIMDVIMSVNNIDMVADDADIDIDTDESFTINGTYILEGTYVSCEGDWENPPEFDSEYPSIYEKTILKALNDKFSEYSFKLNFEEYPVDEEILS